MNNKVNRRSIMNHIYREIREMTSHIYKDDDWGAVSNLCAKIRKVLSLISEDLELAVSVHDGGYRTSSDGMSRCKEYCLSIENEGKEIIAGTLTAHAAGSIADPFDRYDMTVVLWKA